jgi:hypothetical protein
LSTDLTPPSPDHYETTLRLGRQYLHTTNLEEPRLEYSSPYRELHWRGKIALAQIDAFAVAATVLPGVAWDLLKEASRNHRCGVSLLGSHLPQLVRARNGRPARHDLGTGPTSAGAAVELALRAAGLYVELIVNRIVELSGNPDDRGPTPQEAEAHWHAAMNRLAEVLGRRRSGLRPELHQCGLSVTEEALAAEAIRGLPPAVPCPVRRGEGEREFIICGEPDLKVRLTSAKAASVAGKLIDAFPKDEGVQLNASEYDAFRKYLLPARHWSTLIHSTQGVKGNPALYRLRPATA